MRNGPCGAQVYNRGITARPSASQGLGCKMRIIATGSCIQGGAEHAALWRLTFLKMSEMPGSLYQSLANKSQARSHPPACLSHRVSPGFIWKSHMEQGK